MLGAAVVLCVLLGVFLWWLVNNYDEESSSSDEQRQQPEHQRRRNRGNKNKKRKQRGGKDTAAKAPIPPVPSSTGSSQKPPAPALDAKEWPTLANSSPADQEEEDEEDLAALHAGMLKTARSVATDTDKGKAGEGGREGRKNGRIGVGDRVEGRFEAGAEWFPAVVTKTLHGGLVNLLYDDGERETRVPLTLVKHRGAPLPECSDSDASSESDRSEEETEVHGLPVARENRKQTDGWEVIVQKPKKTRVERVESRVEANSNLKNRLKRQKKREKELAAREALRKQL